MHAKMVEDQWTTTIRAVFFLQESQFRKVSTIDLPLPGDLGLTFALSSKKQLKKDQNTRPSSFSFRRCTDSTIFWGRTSIHAQLSLATRQPQDAEPGDCEDAKVNVDPSSIAFVDAEEPLGTINVDMANTSSVDVPITIPRHLSILAPNKVCLTVTMSDRTVPNGLLQARSGSAHEGKSEARLAGKDYDHVLCRSLATGKPFDVKFLTPSTRSTSGEIGDPLPTYASLSMLEGHVDLSSSILGEGWKNALATLDDTSTKCVRVISCPGGYEYEPDSDFEDEDETPPRNSSTEHDLATREDCQSDSSTRMSGSSFASFNLESGSDRGQPEEVINVKGLKEPSFDLDCEQMVEIKFAAHRTWHAFLWHCCTGNLEFGNLKSQVAYSGRHLRATPLEGRPPPCSPKSMYRLADLVGDMGLKAKSLAAVKERTTEENVLDEAFSVFTSKYPEVREVQLGVLKEHRRSPKVKQAFPDAMAKYSSMPHVKPILSAFYDNFVASETSTTSTESIMPSKDFSFSF